jgi:hypothetical protein
MCGFHRRRSVIASTRRGAAVGIGLAVLSAIPAGRATAEGGKTSVTTAVAATSWAPGPHLRVYRSNGDRVTERAWDGNGPWYAGAFDVPGQTVTATSWLDPAIHIRVYVIDRGAAIEYCWDGSGPWYRGARPL